MAKLTATVSGKVVAFDTAPLIYYLEEHPSYLALTDELFGAIDRGLVRGFTSVLTLLEVLVKPMRDGRFDLVARYRELLTDSAGLTLYSIDEATSVRSATLRAKYSWLRTPDAIQIATAIEHGADLVVTNDDRWKDVSEIRTLVLKDFNAA